MKLTNANKSYKDQVVFENLNLEITKPGAYGIVGLSGSGKSTLLNMLYGIDLDYDGEYLLDNTNIKNIKLSENYNDNISIVFQDTKLLENLSVIDNLKLANKTNCDMDQLLDQFNILDLKKVKVKLLSGGEKQRIAFARAIINDPRIILLDEPTAALDDRNTKFITDTIKNFGADKIVLVISHDERIIEELDIVYELVDQNIRLIKGDLNTNYGKEIKFKEVAKNKNSLIKIAHKNLRANKFTLIPTAVAMLILTVFFTYFLMSMLPFVVEDINEYVKEGEVTVERYNHPTHGDIAMQDYYDIVEIVGEENVELISNVTASLNPTGIYNTVELNQLTLDYLALDNKDAEYLLGEEVTIYASVASVDAEYVPFDETEIIGEMPSNVNEVLVPSYMAQLVYNTTDYESMIGEIIEFDIVYEVYSEENPEAKPTVYTYPISLKVTGVYESEPSNAAYAENLDNSIETLVNGGEVELVTNVLLYNKTTPYYELTPTEQEQLVNGVNIVHNLDYATNDLSSGSKSMVIMYDYNDPNKAQKQEEVSAVLGTKYDYYTYDNTKEDLVKIIGIYLCAIIFAAFAFAIILGILNLMNLRLRKDEFAKYYLLGYTNKKILPSLGLEFIYLNLIVLPVALIIAITMFKDANPHDILPYLNIEIFIVLMFTIFVNIFVILWYAIVNRRGKILKNLREGK